MSKYELTKEDLYDIEKLLIVSRRIKCLYDKLCLLEIKLRKHSEEYIKIINDLKILLEQENNIYDKIGDNPIKLSEILFRLFDCEQPNSVDVLSYARDNFVNELIKARIGFRLEKILTDAKFPEDEEPEEINAFLDIEAIETLCNDDDSLNPIMNIEDVEKQFSYMSSLEDSAEIDVLNTILTILKQYICDNNFVDIRYLLIRFKYMLSFAFRKVEQDFLCSNFEISRDLYWSAKLVVDFHNGNIKDLKMSNEGFSEDIMYEQCDNLTRLIFEDLTNKDNFGSGVISEIIIRASLLFSSNETIKNFKNFILCELKDSETDNKIIEEIINRSVNSVEVDKGLPRILSFKL